MLKFLNNKGERWRKRKKKGKEGRKEGRKEGNGKGRQEENLAHGAEDGNIILIKEKDKARKQ